MTLLSGSPSRGAPLSSLWHQPANCVISAAGKIQNLLGSHHEAGLCFRKPEKNEEKGRGGKKKQDSGGRGVTIHVFVLNRSVRGFRFGVRYAFSNRTNRWIIFPADQNFVISNVGALREGKRAHNVETPARPQHCPTSNGKRNASGTKLLVIMWLKDRLSVWTNAARANRDHATHSANKRKALEFATEVITSLLDLVRNIHISPLLTDQTALTWKPGETLCHEWTVSVHRSATFTMDLL